jgi:signal transduction histidine kinase
MARRIALLVAATTSGVVVAFVLPLCVLLANLAETQATTRAQQQAQEVATLVAAVTDTDTLDRTVATNSAEGPEVVVVEPDGTVLGGTGDGTLPAYVAAAVDRARTERAAFTSDVDGGRIAVVPVLGDRGLDVVVSTVTSDELRAGVAGAWLTVGALGVGLVGLSVAVAWWLGRRISIPVTEVATVAHRLREGEADARAVPGGPPETAELGRALNALADRIHVLVAAEREHVADLGHRLRTPVTALRLDTDLVEDPAVADRLREHVDALQRGIDEVVREARRPVTDEMRPAILLAPLLTERVGFWRALAEDQGRRLDLVVLAPGARVGVSADDAREILDTLLDNVFAHTPEGAGARVLLRSAAGEVHVVVEDAGPGMTAPWQGRGHSGAGSTGLGLAIVHRLVEGAGGSVRLGPSELGGLRVELRLPAATA